MSIASKPSRFDSRVAVIILILAAIPPLLVFSDRWFDNQDLANYLRDVWCRVPWLCDLAWRPYFIFIWFISLVIIALVRLCGVESIQRAVTYPEPQSKERPSDSQRRFGVMLMVAALIGVAIEVVRLVLAPTIPGWDYILVCALYIGGWFLITTPRVAPVKFLRARWRLIVAYALGLAALSWLLFSIYGRSSVSPFALILLGVAILALFWMRREISPSYWIVLLALVVMTLNLNAWNFTVIGDEYAFYETGSDIAFNKSIIDMGNELFNGVKVYGSHPYLSSLLMAPTMRIFDALNFGWRFGTILPSAFSIFFFYYFFRTFLARWVALTAAFLIAVSHYLMVFSRIGYNNTQALLAMSMAFAAATWAIKSQRRFAFVMFGIALAYCLYTFPAALFVIPVAVWLLLVYYPPRNRVALTNWGIALGTWLIFFMPLLFQPEYWTSKLELGTLYARADEVTSAFDLVKRFAIQFGYAFYSFLFIPSESHYVRVSYVDVITATLVLVGFAVVLWRVRADKFAFFVLTGFLGSVFLVGATHGTNFPPNTRMFLLLPWFVLLAALALQWFAFQFRNFSTNPVRGRVGLAAVLVAILAANLYQAYDTSAHPPSGFLEFDALFVRAAENMQAQSNGAARSIAFVYDPSRHFIPALQREFNMVYTPVTLRGIDVTNRQPRALARFLVPNETVVALSPQLETKHADAYESFLQNSNWLECAVVSVRGQKRIALWYAPEAANPCGTTQLRVPVVYPNPFIVFIIVLGFLLVLGALIFMQRRNISPLALAQGAIGERSAGLPFGGSVRLYKQDLPNGKTGNGATALGKPSQITHVVSGAENRRGYTWELNIRFSFYAPEDKSVTPETPTEDGESETVEPTDSSPTLN